jgi:modulator of FtsH protease
MIFSESKIQNQGSGIFSAYETNKTLRNTFALLALTMIPTVLAVIISISLKLPLIFSKSPVIFLITMMLIMFFTISLINKNAEKSSSVYYLFVLSGIMGLIMSVSIEHYLNMRNGSNIIILATIGTLSTMAGCSIYAMNTKKDFSRFGGALTGAIIAIMILYIIDMFLQVPVVHLVIAAVAVIVFSAFLIYDVLSIVQNRSKNYVLSTLDVYLDIINIFSLLTDIIGLSSRD